ncbi:unnamed protein product [Malus baccata var. baccata]
MEALPIPTDTYKLGFIGAGKMAESIARGIVRSGVLPPNRISTFHPDPSRRQAFDCIVIFSVKPQVVKDVVLQLRPLLSRKKLLVSIAAGVKLKDLQDWASHSRFIRVMPNTPSAVGAAASGTYVILLILSLGGGATEQDGDLITKVFGSIGKTWKADEIYFDAVTGLRYWSCIYLAIEALADGGLAAGLPRELALGLASCMSFFLTNFNSVLGAASMACHTGKHPGQLKDDVASPGGTTIAGVHELEKGGFRGILMNAVPAAAKRSREFSQS